MIQPADLTLPRPDVSVVIPVYKNAATLAELTSRLSGTLHSHSLTFEIVFVNDGCEESLEALAELAPHHQEILVIALERNAGQQQAVMVGLGAASGRRVVILDADLQDPPEFIPRLLVRLEEGFEAVFAGRRGNYESSFRLLTSRVFKWLLHKLGDVPADASIFVAMSDRLASRLLSMRWGRPYVVGMIGCAGLPVTSIPLLRSPRPSGASAYTTWERVRTGWLAVTSVMAWKYFGNGRGSVRPAVPPGIKARFGKPYRVTERVQDDKG